MSRVGLGISVGAWALKRHFLLPQFFILPFMLTKTIIASNQDTDLARFSVGDCTLFYCNLERGISHDAEVESNRDNERGAEECVRFDDGQRSLETTKIFLSTTAHILVLPF